MIVQAGVTVIGRHEEHTEVSDRYLVDKVSQVSSALHDHLVHLVQGRGEEWIGPRGFLSERKPSPEESFWEAWGAVACLGPWDRWSGFMFMELEGLGLTSAPTIVEQWWVTARGDAYKLQCPTGSNAMVMHQTSRLLNWKKWPIKGPNKAQARAALEQILKVDGQLEELSMHARPDAFTKGGLTKALREHNLRLVMPKLNGGAHKMTATYKLEPIPKVSHGYAPYGIELDVEDMEANRVSQDAAWTTLDGAIRERV